MPELLQEYQSRVKSNDGATFVVRAYAEERPDRSWIGWLEFHPIGVGAPVLRTGQETSQPDRKAVIYWAEGIEPIYLEGALERAR